MLDVRVYCATPMSNLSRAKLLKRAKYMVALGKECGVTVISPVIEEKVGGKGLLIQDDELRLYTFWKRDKNILRNRDGKGAHVLLVDGADKKSFGCEREYGFARYCLFKPSVSIMPNHGLSVARYEDDRIFERERDAFEFVAREYGTQLRRIKWRLRMLARSIPGLIIDHIAAFR